MTAAVTQPPQPESFAFGPDEKAASGDDPIARLHSRDDFNLLA